MAAVANRRPVTPSASCRLPAHSDGGAGGEEVLASASPGLLRHFFWSMLPPKAKPSTYALSSILSQLRKHIVLAIVSSLLYHPFPSRHRIIAVVIRVCPSVPHLKVRKGNLHSLALTRLSRDNVNPRLLFQHSEKTCLPFLFLPLSLPSSLEPTPARLSFHHPLDSFQDHQQLSTARCDDQFPVIVLFNLLAVDTVERFPLLEVLSSLGFLGTSHPPASVWMPIGHSSWFPLLVAGLHSDL